MSGIVYAIEKLQQWRRDAEPFLHDHWREMSPNPNVQLDPDWAMYDRLETVGGLVIYTARIDGELIGYAFFMGGRSHPHYKTMKWMINDNIRINPDYRRKGIGTGLLDFAEEDLKRRGVDYIQIHAKTKHPELAKMLESRKYISDEQIYTRRL